MYMATIYGYYEVRAFSEDVEKAKKLVVKEKKKYCVDDLDIWNWEGCKAYYGAHIEEIKEGLVLTGGM